MTTANPEGGVSPKRIGPNPSPLAILAIIFAFLVLGFWLHREMNRPLEQDELVTLKKYTGLGYTETAEQVSALHALNVRRLGVGVSKCFVNTWDPNNHIVNSLSISVSQFFFGFSEKAFRLPALIASILLSITIFFWGLRMTRSFCFAVLCGLLLLLHPYFIHYGQTARGYSIGAFLLLIQLILVERIIRRPTVSLWSIATMSLVSTLLFLNLVSMLIFWLIPLWVVGYFAVAKNFPLEIAKWQSFVSEPKRQAWAFHGFVVCLAIGIFVSAHLQEFLVSQSKYGVALGVGQSASALASLRDCLFPGAWIIFGLLGGAGLLLMLQPKRFHWLGAVSAGSFAFTIIYAVATRKLPYERTFGFWLVLFVMGLVWLWNATDWFGIRSRKLIRSTLVLALVATLTTSALPGFRGKTQSPAVYSEMAFSLRNEFASQHIEARHALVCLPWVWGEEMKFYLPSDPNYFLMATNKTAALDIYFPCIEANGKYVFRTQYAERAKQEMVYWPIPESWHPMRTFAAENGAIFRIPCRVLLDFDEKLSDGPAIVIWNQGPYFALSHYVADNLKSGGLTIHVNTIDYLPVTSLQMFASNATELQQAKAVVADLKAKSSGELYLLVPTDPEPLRARSKPQS